MTLWKSNSLEFKLNSKRICIPKEGRRAHTNGPWQSRKKGGQSHKWVTDCGPLTMSETKTGHRGNHMDQGTPASRDGVVGPTAWAGKGLLSTLGVLEGGGGCIGRGEAPPPPPSAKDMPRHCFPDGKCQLQWHL